ncbi:hypothetical protein EMCRGX_G029670 [Ephydatia muelleri]
MRERIRATKEVSEPTGTLKEGRRRLPAKLQADWDSLLWMFASFALLYYTEFASTIIFSALINRLALWCSLSSALVSILCCAYAFKKVPHLSSANWQTEAPAAVITATISALLGGTSLIIAIWPVWGIYSTVIVSVLFMGFISTVSLLDLCRFL